MKLNPNGKLAQFYKWNYPISGWRSPGLPHNLCPFFWMIVLAVVFFPITWTTYPFEYRSNTFAFFKRVCTGIGMWLGFIFAAGIIFKAVSSFSTFIGVIGFLLMVIAIAAGMLALAIGILICAGWGYRKAKDAISSSEFINEITSVVSEKKSSFKDKYCPKIDWE